MRFVRLCLVALCLATVACGEANGGGGGAGDGKDAGGASGGDNTGNDSGSNSNGGNTGSPDSGDPIQEDSGSDAEMPPSDDRRQKVVSVAPPYGVAGESYGYSPKSDQTGETAWAVKSGPAGMSVDEKSQSVAWTPNAMQGGKHEVQIEGTSGDKAVTQSYEMYVAVPEKQAGAMANPKAASMVAVSSPKSDLQGTAIYTAPGAVKDPVELSISQVDKAPPMRGSKGEITAVQFGPSGTVFQRPALVALPLTGDGTAPALSRIGAFVYNPKGSWERVPIVRVDLENRLVYARASHFSLLTAAESAFALETSLATMPATSACEGELVGRAVLQGSLDQIPADAVNNLPSELRGVLTSDVSKLSQLLSQAAVSGSFRFSRLLTLTGGTDEARVSLESRLLVTTLYLPGDGSATVTHSDAFGNMLATFAFASLADSFAEIEQHARGAHTHALFSSGASSALALSASLHVTFYEGDASLDPASPDDLGLALVDAPAGEPFAPAPSDLVDGDCDGLSSAVDDIDNRQLPSFDALPREVASTVVGSPVRLSVLLRNAPEDPAVSFSLLDGGSATLTAVSGEPNARDLVALTPGRYLVEAKAQVGGATLSHVFAVDVALASEVPACLLTTSSAQIKVGESVTLSAVLANATAKTSALSFEWGTVSAGDFTAFAGPEAASTATFKPASMGTVTLACRASNGVTTGATGTVTVDVLAQNENRAPEDLVLSPPSVTLTPTESLTLVASASDPDGDALAFTWSASGGTLGTPNTSAGTSTSTFQAGAGRYEITVSITDGSAPAAVLTTQVLVISDRVVLEAADADGDGWPEGAGLDCNDNDEKVHPGAVDACGDDIDDDCADGPRASDCDDDGLTTQDGDCDDENPHIQPGAFEYCDGIDNDCDQGVDEREVNPVGATCSRGVGACATAGVYVCAGDALNTVCNAPAIAPSAELCNGIDDNCDGVIAATELDDDGDGLAECAGDCDDTRKNVRAGISDLCDAVDNDCDGRADEDHLAEPTSCGIGVCAASGVFACVNGEIVDSCAMKQPTGVDDDCDGVDDDCDGETDESFATEVSCGLGVCQASGSATCSGGKVAISCTPGQGAPSDSVCNGLDDDCDGSTDEDTVSFPFDVCNGVDDDCNGEIDPVSCEPGEIDPNCIEAPETCNMHDDDCDGVVDDGNVCGIALSTGSLLGAWWRCVDATCTTRTESGLFFTSALGPMDSFSAFSLKSLSAAPYDPAAEPYCSEAPLGYTHNQATGDLVISWQEQGTIQQAIGTVTIDGLRATIHWTTAPGEDGNVYELVRVPEQAAGTCMPFECAPFETCGNQTDDNCDGLIDNGCPDVCFPEEVCDNGIDDDCDEAVDGMDTNCGGACMPNGSHFELCNGQDDDCDGMIDELNTPCELPSLFGECAKGQQFFAANCEDFTCQQVKQPGVEYCDDGRDTDCDGQGENDGQGVENNEPDCQTLADGEACFNAIDVSQGGTFATSFAGSVRNQMSSCGAPYDATDRVYKFTIPPSPFSTEVFLDVRGADVMGAMPIIGSVFAEMCDGQPIRCFSAMGGSRFSTHLMPGTYFVVLHGDPDALGVTLTFGSRGDGCDGPCACMPGDSDGDQATVCDGDCNEGNDAIGPFASEACNGIDDDCNGQIDDLSGTCTVDALGVCGLGRSSCLTAEATTCSPVHAAGIEYCNDEADTDCDGDASSSEADCDLSDAEGETCFGATYIGTGGTFSGTLVGANDDLTLTTCGGGGSERVYAFDAPAGLDYYDIFVRRVRGNGRLDFTILRDCEYLTVERCLGGGGGTYLPSAGTYFLVVEGDPGEYTFTLGVTGNGTCLTEDLDGDGWDACYGDCDEGDPLVNMDGDEGAVCDGVDNDCSGMIDDLSAPCDLTSAQGECRKGLVDCQVGCQQVTYAQDSVEVCDDGLDNDCDGDADDLGSPGIDCTPSMIPGETCGLATDVSAGGHFTGSLVSALDNVEVDCGPMNAPDQFFRIELLERRQLFTRVTVHSEFMPPDGRGPMLSVAVLDESCARAGLIACVGYGSDVLLDPGTYFLVVEGPEGITFDLDVSSQLEGGGPETCIPGDLDQDGQTACDGDCGEGNPDVHGWVLVCDPECHYEAAPEVCDNLDNDCNFVVDDIPVTEPCTVPDALGTCAQGKPACEAGTPVCLAEITPKPERCGDGLDTDCDGEGTGLPDQEPDCNPMPPGDMCSIPIDISASGMFESSLSGTAPDAFPCGPEGMLDRYFVYTPSQEGYLHVDVKAFGAQSNEVYTHISSACGMMDYCTNSDITQYYVVPGQPYYLSIAAPFPVDFQLRVALEAFDGQDWICTAAGTQAGDFDADGVSLCDFDCDESNPNVYPGQTEICNGIDDDCSGGPDNVYGECIVPGQLGECAKGYAYGCAGPEVACDQYWYPDIEYCEDGLDTDCDGSLGVDESDCTSTQ